ncbi:major capsid protein [Cupriavidus sp. SS-3]|uniref:major capsid protein n=1 Tax=Cupriavidus sp. SS-3 TaxID=3109596 RepID=UPI002DBC1F21|nr:major capsid protein [Cupriavidus sp. SS-3]MEC3765006.1 major capsid protein [Cupriavidus sp. SS-3]
MASLDVFNDDAFSVMSLTRALNQVPEGQQVPMLLDGLFTEEGVTTTQIAIERENDQLALVPDTPRGAPGQVVVGNKRDVIPFQALHLPVRGVVRADEVQGIRAFGSETEAQAVQTVVNQRIAKMRRKIDATLTYHRVGAVTGKIYDADGQRVLVDLYERFGIAQQTVNFALDNAGTKVLTKITDARRKAEDALTGAGVITGWLGIVGRNFYDAFTTHASVEKAFDRWNDGQFLRDDMRAGFNFGNVVWKEFYGRVGNIDFINPDEGYLIPLGVPDMFVTNFAPGDYLDVVNTLGLPYYASQELLDHRKGVDLEAQSNPLTLNTRPRGVIKLRKS